MFYSNDAPPVASHRSDNSPKYQIDAKECEHDYAVSHNACRIANLVKEKKPFVNQSGKEKEKQNRYQQDGATFIGV